MAVTKYFVIADPPSLAGLSQDTVMSKPSRIALTFLGTDGAVAGSCQGVEELFFVKASFGIGSH